MSKILKMPGVNNLVTIALEADFFGTKGSALTEDEMRVVIGWLVVEKQKRDGLAARRGSVIYEMTRKRRGLIEQDKLRSPLDGILKRGL